MSTTSPVVETVSRRRLIPPSELQAEGRERKTPEFWEFIETMTPDMWANDYLLYILREEPKPSLYGGTNTLEKCPGYIAMSDGTKQPLTSREDIELAIKQKYGGKAFRLILKKGSERIAEGKCMNEAPVRTPDVMGYPAHPLPNGPQAATDASVASKAIDAMASQQPDAVRLAMDVLRSASDIVMRQAQQPNAPPVAPPSSSLIDQTILQTLIQRALQPPPDPIELLIKLKQIEGPAANSNPLVDKLLNAAVDRFMTPVAAVATGKTTLLDLGREVLPTIATTARDAVHEWRLGVEAQVRGVELARGMNPPPGVPPVASSTGVAGAMPQNVPPVTPPAAAPAAEPVATAPTGEPPFDWLAIKIVEILREPDYTVDQAVDETLSFLYRSHTPIVALLLDPPKLNASLVPGEQGLLMLFQHHPVLKQIQVNPRLVEFIKKFIAQAKEAEAERLQAPAAAATPAPAATAPA